MSSLLDHARKVRGWRFRFVCRAADLVLCRAGDLSRFVICLTADAAQPGLSYVPSVKPIRALAQAVRDHSFASDAVLAIALAAFAFSDIITSNGYLSGSDWVYVPVVLLMTLPLAWRRRAPLVVVVVVMGAFAAQSLILDPTPTPDVELIPALIAVYSVAAHGERWESFLGGAVGLGAGLIWLGIDDFLLPVVMFGGAWLAGRLVQKMHLYAQAFAERARVLELERDANARVAAAEERVRIAREMHDAVGHSVSVMVVQAGAERLALGDERPATREALLAIERTGREALAEMSRLLGILRKDGEGLSLAPRPSLAQIDALVQTVRDAGVPVALSVEGKPTELPPGVDVSAYRIVQEALTNIVKHAGPATATVVVRYGRRAVEVEVTDDGRGSVNGKTNGHGLIGMRERIELHGGTLEAGGRRSGGFAVRARLPLETVRS
jgi:signal transduction histidine kinase